MKKREIPAFLPLVKKYSAAHITVHLCSHHYDRTLGTMNTPLPEDP